MDLFIVILFNSCGSFNLKIESKGYIIWNIISITYW